MKKVQFFITGLGPGGAERQLTGLACLLKERGYKVQVCWYTDINFYESYLINEEVDCKRLYTSNHLKKIFNIWNSIRQFKPDIVISYLDGPNTISSYLKAFTFGKYKLIVSERNTTQRIDWRTRLRFWGYKFADCIVPNSNSQALFIAKNYPQYKTKTTTITNFTDLVKFSPRPKDYCEALHGMVAARITEAKNVKRFIKAVALARNKGARIDISWFGKHVSNDYLDECHQLIQSLNMESYFHLFPATQQIIEEYRSNDVVILPSLYEGFPNVVCEAISCGLPVLCSDICDNRSLVKDGVNGYLFNPLDEESISNTLFAFCSLPESERQNMGKESRIIAESILSKEHFVNKYIELFDSLGK